jgi:hypothetical protein
MTNFMKHIFNQNVTIGKKETKLKPLINKVWNSSLGKIYQDYWKDWENVNILYGMRTISPLPFA